MICSRCGCEIEDAMISIETKYKIYKVDGDLVEEYGAVSDTTSEILCQDCFNNYVEVLNMLNQTYCGNFLADTTAIVDEEIKDGSNN